MHARTLFATVAFALAAASSACGPGDGGLAAGALSGGGTQRGDGRAPGHDLTVMTRNLFVGADLFEPFVSPDPLLAASTVFARILASDVPGRMAAIADEIDLARPDLVGIQEGFRFIVTPVGAEAPILLDLDFLGALEQALAERPRPLHYERVAEDAHTTLTIPFVDQGIQVTVIDRDAILADQDVHVHSTGGGDFAAEFATTLAGVIPVRQRRGWTEVAAKYHGDTFTFVNTHLEIKELGPLQSFQADELLARFGHTEPTIVVGDMNSDPFDPPNVVTTQPVLITVPTPYTTLARAFTDAWTVAGSGPGLTCCFDQDLTPPSRPLFERVDLVLYRGDDILARSAFRVGLEPLAILGDRWPSDHAGVVAVLNLRAHDDDEDEGEDGDDEEDDGGEWVAER